MEEIKNILKIYFKLWIYGAIILIILVFLSDFGIFNFAGIPSKQERCVVENFNLVTEKLGRKPIDKNNVDWKRVKSDVIPMLKAIAKTSSFSEEDQEIALRARLLLEKCGIKY